jgi:hypothetical protein
MARYRAETYVFDRSGYGTREQDVTPWVSKDSKFRNASRSEKGGGTMHLVFPDGTPNLKIDDFMEVWHGVKDTWSGNWSRARFGGYIMGHKNTTYGREHVIDCNLVSYSWDLERTEVIAWPTDPRITTTVEGFPNGYSAYQWLVEGGGGYPGFMPYHFGGMAFTGIDDVYDQIVFDGGQTGGARPTLSTLYGLILTTNVQKALAEIADCAQFIKPDIEPHFFVKAIAKGDSIVPEFNFIDVNNIELFDGLLFSDDPDPENGVYAMVDFFHDRDPMGARGRITVVGSGLDPTRADHPWVIATVTNPLHLMRYPTIYQKYAGTAGEPIINDRIGTVAEATDYAQTIADIIWGPKGRIGFRTKVPVREGTYIWVKHTVQDIDRAYPVQSVVLTDGWYEVIAGISQKDLARMTGPNMVNRILQRHDQSWRNPYVTDWASLQLTPPNSPPNAGVDKSPSASTQNIVQPILDTVPALVIKPAQNQSMTTREGFTIKADFYEETPEKDIVDNVTFQDKDGVKKEWYDRDNGGHPHTDKIVLQRNGHVRVPVAENFVAYIQAIMRPAGTGAVLSNWKINGVAASAPSPSSPLTVTFGDYIDFDVSGASVSAASPLTIMLTEKPQEATGGSSV